MRILIIEDEAPASKNIIENLLQIDPATEIVGVIESVAESIKWLSRNSVPELIFMDIQLSDGNSFSILNSYPVTSPVIFITAHDQYFIQAFEYNSIDYILKPVNKPRLEQALTKYQNLRHHFVNNFIPLLDFINNPKKIKTKILVRKGTEFQTLNTIDIAYFFTEHKLVFVVDKENRKFMAEKANLTELEKDLDKKMYYRANRKFIINANYIKNFKSFDKSKVSVEMQVPIHEEIIVSQENSASFKKWISEL